MTETLHDRMVQDVLDRETRLENALREAIPYVYNVECDPANAPWRRETAAGVLARIREALGD